MKRSNETLIDFCYRLLQVGVFLSAVICFFSVCFERMVTEWKHFAVMFLTVVLFFAFRKLNKRQRIYTFLFMVSFLVIFFGATGREKFAEWIFAGNSLLWTAGLAVFVCALHLLSEKYFFLKISFVAALYALLLYALFTVFGLVFWHSLFDARAGDTLQLAVAQKYLSACRRESFHLCGKLYK